MNNYVKRAMDLLQKKYDEPLKVISILEDDKFVLISLATKELEESNSGMFFPRFAVNKQTGKEYYGEGIGWIYDPEFEGMLPNTMKEVNFLEVAS